VVWLWLTNVALLLGAEINAAGRYEEGRDRPLTPTGHSPEQAQHAAASVEAAGGHADGSGSGST